MDITHNNELTGKDSINTVFEKFYFDIAINDYLDSTRYIKKYPNYQCTTKLKNDTIEYKSCISSLDSINKNYQATWFDSFRRPIIERSYIYDGNFSYIEKVTILRYNNNLLIQKFENFGWHFFIKKLPNWPEYFTIKELPGTDEEMIKTMSEPRINKNFKNVPNDLMDFMDIHNTYKYTFYKD